MCIQYIYSIGMGTWDPCIGFSLQYVYNVFRDMSLTMGAGGLLNRWGITQFLDLILGGITQFPVPFMRGNQQINRILPTRCHKTFLQLHIFLVCSVCLVPRFSAVNRVYVNKRTWVGSD